MTNAARQAAPKRDSSGRPVRAVALMSGGLDSLLAAAVTVRQGVDVIGVHYAIGFAADPFAAERIGLGAGFEIEVRHRDVSAAYIPAVLLNPRYGYGQGMNPCLDCHLFMLRLTRDLMQAEEAHFVITGEVLGQRPMSQHRPALNLLARESGLGELLVRPLSAPFLELTRPERKGWLDRSRLPRIRGRSRRRQMELAEEFGITAYAQPAGGCLLPDPGYSRRLADLLEHTSEPAVLTPTDMKRLRYGRYLRLQSGIAVQIGRNEADNTALAELAAGYWQIETVSHGGPLTLVESGAAEADLEFAAALTARYSQGRDAESVTVRITSPEGQSRQTGVTPSPAGTGEAWMIP